MMLSGKWIVCLCLLTTFAHIHAQGEEGVGGNGGLVEPEIPLEEGEDAGGGDTPGDVNADSEDGNADTEDGNADTGDGDAETGDGDGNGDGNEEAPPTPAPLPADPCAASPCENAGTCETVSATEYNCTCPELWTGDNCTDRVDVCAPVSPCQNGGNCTQLEDSLEYNCTCEAGYNGTHCENDIDDCVGVTCENGGVCVDAVNGYACNCTQQWTGVHCETDVDECTDAVLHGCGENAECNNYAGGHNCTCKSGYEQDGDVCAFINMCTDDPCVNGACIAQMLAYECHCDEGWTGENCDQDLDECADDSHDCDEDFGVCTNTNGSYSCACPEGYMNMGDGYLCIEHAIANIMYPYINRGVRHTGDPIPKIVVAEGIPYFGDILQHVQVHYNGYITLGSVDYDRPSAPVAITDEVPEEVRFVAPYWSEIDGTDPSGAVVIEHFNQETEFFETIAELVTNDTKMAAPDLDFASVTNVVIVTWEKVRPYPADVFANEHATFQVVLASGPLQSVMFFNYAFEEMRWTRASEEKNIVSGFSDGHGNVESLGLSNHLSPDTGSNIDNLGRFFYTLGDAVDSNNMAQCMAFIQQNQQIVYDDDMHERCPCSRHQAALLSWMEEDAMGCFSNRFQDMPKVLCCYDVFGSLDSRPGKSRLLRHENDAGLQMCCEDTSLCHMYARSNLPATCSHYTPPHMALVYGDPHFSRHDGQQFTFNGLGEYNLVHDAQMNLTVQGRFEAVAGVAFNVSRLTAFAVYYHGYIVEVQQDGGSILLNGELEGDLPTLSAKVILPQQGYVEKSSDNNLLMLLDAHVALKVTHAHEMFALTLYLPGENMTSGMLLDALPETPTDEQIHEWGKPYQISMEDSLFTYPADKTYADYNSDTVITSLLTQQMANLSMVEGLNVTEVEEVCGENFACRFDFVATMNRAVAETTLQQYDQYQQQKTALVSTPPELEVATDVWKVSIGKPAEYVLIRMDSSHVVVLNTTLPIEMTVSDENITLRWSPSEALRDQAEAAWVRVVVTDAHGNSAVFWPEIHLCPCENDVTCMDRLAATAESMIHYSPDKFYILPCDCPRSYTGEYCGEPQEYCGSGLCYPGNNCTDAAADTCGTCPEGLEGDGERCYEKNECALGLDDCAHECFNTRGSYTCGCRQGYESVDNGKECIEIDECTLGTDYHDCTADGQYCVNTDGGYECHCKPGYYKNESMCVLAPRHFGGTLTFMVLKGKYNKYEPSMGQMNTVEARTVSEAVDKQLMNIYGEKYGEEYIGSEVVAIKEGSIAADYNLYFSMEAPVNGSVLNDDMQKYLEDEGCMETGPDCLLGDLSGVDVKKSFAAAKDLCADSEDNDCDEPSTDCTSKADGTFFCTCKAGYERWLDLKNICQDIDECTEGSDTCDEAVSECVDAPGSYSCQCKAGYANHADDDKICTAVCDPNPCQNDGECLEVENEFACKCTAMWGGPTCEEENSEAARYRTIAIAVGVTLAIICLILLVLLIVACLSRKGRRTPPTRTPRTTNPMTTSE